LLRLLSLTLPRAGSDHLPPGLLSQSGRARSVEDMLFRLLSEWVEQLDCVTLVLLVRGVELTIVLLLGD